MTRNCVSGLRDGECPGNRRLYRHLHYCLNRQQAVAYSAMWRRNNPDRVALYSSRDRSDYFGRQDVKDAMLARSKAWAIKNRDKIVASSESYRKRNKALYAGYAANRRCLKLRATPPWLDEKSMNEILLFYKEAERLTSETGIPHEVDHIEPLNGFTICGLHVPWNLRVVTREFNRRRPRVWADAAFNTAENGHT